MINPEHIEAIIEMANSSPFYKLLDLEICEISKGYARVETGLSKNHLNLFGVLHGGVYASLIDTAAYWSVYCDLGEDAGYTTIDLSVSNLSMAREGKIIAEGKSIKTGRSICLTEATVRSANDKLLAHGTSKLMILDGRQTVNQAVDAMGFRALPPKFIY
jgi:uncharacterized protein (TIGR00369 family)